MARGIRKNIKIERMKKRQGGKFSTLLKQTKTVEPS